MIRSHLTQPGYRTAIFWVAALPVLYFISRYNYNLFHSVVDGASIVIAASVFMIIWNARRILDNEYFLYVGISFLFFAFLDFMHVLGNKNMGVFPEYENLGPALYIASRYILSISLLIAPLFINRKLNRTLVFAMYSVVTLFILLSIFHWQTFPVCIVEGVGLTPFKVISDYIICLILLGAIGLLLSNRRSFDSRVLWIVVSSIILSIATGVAFTLYADPFGIMNAVGHFLQVASFYLVYLAIIETSVTKPQDVLYRKLKQSEETLAENLRQLDDANVELKQEITERKRAEVELRQSREWLRVTLKSIGDAVLATDAEGRLIFLNPVGAALTGWKPEEAEGKPLRSVFRIINEKTRKEAEDIVDLVLNKGNTIVLSNPTALLARDGREIPIEDSAAPIKDSSGNIIGAVVVFHDVSEKRLREEALRESEERYRTLFGTMTEGFALHEIITDPQGRPCDYRFLDVNPAFERQTGLKREDLVGKSVLEVLPGTEAHWIENYGRVVLTGEPLHMENYSAALDRWYEVFAYRPAPGRFAVVFKEITERKRADEALRASEAKFRSIFETNVIPIAYCHMEGRILDANDDYLRLIGFTREELAAGEVRWDAVTPPEWEHIDEAALAYLRRDGVCPPYEKEYLRKDGTRVPVLLGACIVPGDSEQVVVFAVDLTERKTMEEELRKSRDELDQRVRKRTVELESRNQELQEFVFVASHDLSEPLRKIQTFGSFLEAKSGYLLDEQSRDYVSRMSGAANRMRELLDALLRYSRVDTKGQEFRPARLDDVVQDAAGDLEVSIKKIGAHVKVGPLPMINGDPYQWRQLFQNLIANAVKYHRSEVKTIIRVYGERNGGTRRIFVEDNGIGFDEKYLDKIFQPFQRLHGKNEYSGTGIGLAICKKIVERHKGTITAKSTPGKGSTFIITLPLSLEKQ